MITREEAIQEIERELKMREQVYPNLIMNGKLNRVQAERQYRRLLAALSYLRDGVETKSSTQTKLF